MKLDTPSITLLVVGLLVTGLGIGFYLYGVSRASKHAFTMNFEALCPHCGRQLSTLWFCLSIVDGRPQSASANN
jgi:hypothetical protein